MLQRTRMLNMVGAIIIVKVTGRGGQYREGDVMEIVKKCQTSKHYLKECWTRYWHVEFSDVLVIFK